MKVPLSWLVEFIDIKLPPEEIAVILTNAGLEVDAIERIGSELSTTLSDTIFEISLTPNLGHCSSILGVARELAAATQVPLRIPEIKVQEAGAANDAKVTVQDSEGCPRYTCRVVRGVKIAPSPDWIQKRLMAAGLRPINNVVDVTNYVLLELGHPLHAFDFDRVAGKEIIVRRAKEGERFKTLDDKERTLSADSLLICDGAKPVALAGVMGGANSEVSDATQNILIESAYFEPEAVRVMSKRVGLQTDSSRRFERGADPNMAVMALDRAAALIREVAHGEVAKGVVDIKKCPFESWTVPLRLSRTNALLGLSLSMSEVEATLRRLELVCKWDGKDTFTVTVPTYRPDIRIEVDLIEEVARLYGYDNIAKESSTAYQASTIPHSPLYLFENEIRERLRGEGLQEFLNCDLISPRNSAMLRQGEMPRGSEIRVMNPVSEEQSVLRTSLLPGFLELIKYNQDHQVQDISGFEIGRVYFKTKEGYGEQTVVGIVMAGKQRPHSWDQQPENVDFFDMKGLLENLFDQLDIVGYTFRKSRFPTFHDGRQASVYIGRLEAASFGEVHPSILRQLGITRRVLFAEINLHDLMQVRPAVEKMRPLPKYPGSERDWTVTLDEKVPIGDLFGAIDAAKSTLLQDVSLRYLYRSDKIGVDKKNATLHFLYRDTEKTVSQDTVESEHARIVDEITKTLKL